MEDMDKETEWLASSIRQNTKLHHKKAMQYLKEYMGTSPEEILRLREQEGKRFNTRITLFWKWLQDEKGLSESSASSNVFGVAGFFSYYDLDLKLKGKIPDTKMKIETYQPKLEDLQKVFRLGDLQVKTVLSIMRDVPCRIGDLVQRVIPRIEEKEFIIESEKEQVVGKCYISEQTLELTSQLNKAKLSLPTTKRGIAKLLERACRVASTPVFNPHILRKYFFTTACNLNINRDILRVLMFKSVSKDILTYLLNRNELREAWEQIVNEIPLEAKSNGRVTNLEETLELVVKAIVKLVKPEVQRQMILKTPSQGLGLLELPKMSPREILQKYLGEEEGGEYEKGEERT